MSRIKYSMPNSYNPSTKDILYSLEAEYQWLDLLKDIGKPYETLINIVQREGEKGEDDNSPIPTIKVIANEINESSAKVTRWLNQMYSDLWDLNDANPHLFKTDGHRYYLNFQNTSTKQVAAFHLWLDRSLNCNEGFHWQFINALLGTYYFYVSEILHERTKGELQTTVYFKSGFYNSYRNTLTDKAIFLNLISLSELYHLNGYELDKALRESVELGRSVKVESSNRNRFKKRGFD